MRRSTLWIWFYLVLFVGSLGCALVDPIPRVGQPLKQAVTGNIIEDPTEEDVIAKIDAMIGEIQLWQAATEEGKSNPFIASTGLLGLFGVLQSTKRRNLEIERERLLAAMKAANVSLPEGTKTA